mmetsp:Transcript_17915/g.21926  ORF Transcript_17915/g.21926 Transcript_17915/m.21926 type:complete len:750 (-) Transcript_17915:143-2392(-)
MTERKEDKLELKMGIEAYASPVVPGFAAVLKARYSDFCVHEVALDGTIARLDSVEVNKNNNDESKSITKENEKSKTEANESKKRDAEEVVDVSETEERKRLKGNDGSMSNNISEVEATKNIDEIMKDIKSKLENLVGIYTATSAVAVLQRWEKLKGTPSSRENPFPPRKGVEDETKYFTLPLIENKETRKEIHMLIKSDLMKNIAMADTVERQVRIWHKIFEKQMPNYKKFGTMDRSQNNKKVEWPKDRPNYLQFALYKENIDTTSAIKDVTRIARLGGSDRRQKGRGTFTGITYAGMKDKRGVTTQFCTVFRKTPDRLLILNQNQKNASGGGNTKGNGSSILRVGNFSYVKGELRLGMLSGNRFDIVLRNVCIEQKRDTMTKDAHNQLTIDTLRSAANAMKEVGFINFFGMQRFGKYHDTHEVGIAVLRGDYKLACDIIMRVKKGENDRYKNLREKWQNRFTDIDMNDDEAANEAEMNCAREMLKGLGRFMNCETSIVHSLSRKPRDYKKAFCTITKHMRSMFLHAYQSYLWNKAVSYRIEKGGGTEVVEGDMVFEEEEAPNGDGKSHKGKRKVIAVTQDDVETGKYKITDVVLPLLGTRVDLPTNKSGAFFEAMLEENGLTIDSFCGVQDRELALGGDYRKIICRPTDVSYEIKLYKDPLQPLIQTDLMAANGESLECVDVTTMTSFNKNNDVGDGDENMEKFIIGIVIGFTLPSSSYATIALRELMKRPTSAEYQSELKLEGECEA